MPHLIKVLGLALILACGYAIALGGLTLLAGYYPLETLVVLIVGMSLASAWGLLSP